MDSDTDAHSTLKADCRYHFFLHVPIFKLGVFQASGQQYLRIGQIFRKPAYIYKYFNYKHTLCFNSPDKTPNGKSRKWKARILDKSLNKRNRIRKRKRKRNR